MALSAQDKANVKAVWEHVKGHEEVYGAEALHSHGKKVMSALTNAAAHIDDIEGCLSKLSDKHAHELMVDPGNFDILAHHILTVLAMFMPQLLTCANHRSVDKFLSRVKMVLTSKYR